MRISPAVISSSPATMRSSVDLPQPDGPTSTTSSPSAISRSTPRIASNPPGYILRTPLSCTPAIGLLLRLDETFDEQALHSDHAEDRRKHGQDGRRPDGVQPDPTIVDIEH